MMLQHFKSMASYNEWANERLYADAARLTGEELHRDLGIYFKSLFGTLAHLLQADRAWAFILEGGPLAEMRLPPVPANFVDLAAARQVEDAAWIRRIDQLNEGWFELPFGFVSALGTWSGSKYTGTNGSAMTHVFNHQTHHRGQAHAALTLLGVTEPAALDIVVKGFLGQ